MKKIKMVRAILTLLLGLSIASGGAFAAADLGKVVHGPVDTPDNQTLTFYRKDNNVTAWFTSPHDSDRETIPDYALTNDSHYELGNVSVVAVFYYDFDKGGQDEIIVMYRDAAGEPHLRAWGADQDQMLPLTRFTPQLDKIAASLDKFTVARTRKALEKLLPQQYLIAGFPQEFSDPLFNKVLTTPEKSHPVFQRYFDELGDDVAKSQQANGYTLIFPDKFIERTNDKGAKTKYTLAMDVIRQGNCGWDDLGFAITGFHYENITAGKDRIKEGPFVEFTLQECKLIKSLEGQYRNNKYEGEVTYYTAQGRLLQKGAFHLGLREGWWQRYDLSGQRKEGKYVNDLEEGVWQTYSETGVVIAQQSYLKGVLSGPWLRKVAAKGSDALWVTEEAGSYLNGNKEGKWQETMTTEPRYAHYHNGLLEGELRVTTLNDRNREISHYQQGLRNGESSVWYDYGQLKKRQNYLYGQRQGTGYYYWDNGKINEISNWKPASSINADLCRGVTSQAVCDQRAAKLAEPLEEGEKRSFHQDGQLAVLSHWHNGEKSGAEYKFNHTGKLFYFARWDGKNEAVEDSVYDYSQTDDYAHKPVRMSLLADTRQLKDGRREQSTFHSGTNKLSRHNFWCSTSWTASAVCGTEYWWHRSGFISDIIQQHHNRKIESTSWDVMGFIDRQTVKTSDKTFSERSYFYDALYMDTIRPAATYHDGKEDVVTADQSTISGVRRYDKQGNLVTFEEQQKRLKESGGR